jgi:1-deoxy-D-xylulose-5-phosphate synthase
MAITPAMCEGSGMVAFSRRFPTRYFDVGIAEQHALTFAAGMACEGLKPVVAIYSTFMQRAYDQLIHDIALQNLDVTLAVDRAGLVGADGATHAGCFDLSYARTLPNMVIMAPADENECRQMLQTAYEHPGPAMVRYPRGSGPGEAVDPASKVLLLGQAEVRREGRRVAFLVFGNLGATAHQVAEELDASLINMRFIKPLDEAMVQAMAERHELLITLEENSLQGGAGSAVNEYLMRAGNPVRVLNLGLPDHFIEHATQLEQLSEAGLDVAGIKAQVQRVLQQSPISVVAGANS